MSVGLCVLLAVSVRYTDPVQQSLQVLKQLAETQQSLQEALQRAGEDGLVRSIPRVQVMLASASCL